MELHDYNKAGYPLIPLVAVCHWQKVFDSLVFFGLNYTVVQLLLQHICVYHTPYALPILLAAPLHFSISSGSVLFPQSSKLSLPFILHLLSRETDNQ